VFLWVEEPGSLTCKNCAQAPRISWKFVQNKGIVQGARTRPLEGGCKSVREGKYRKK
jgi:hypothetical protein